MPLLRHDPNNPVSRALAACRSHFRAIAIFSALLNLLYIAPTLYMLQVYDRVMATQSGLTLLFLTLVLLLALSVLAALDHARSRLLIRAGLRLDRLLAPLTVDETFSARGNRSAAPVQDLDTLRLALTGPGIIAAFDAPWTPVYILVCFMLSPWLGLLATAGALILLLFAWRNEVATKDRLKDAGDAGLKAYRSQEAAIMAADAVRALGMRRALVARNLTLRHEMMAAQTDSSFAGTRWASLSRFARLGIQSLALGTGALLAINNSISAGSVFAAMFLVGRALAPIDLVIGAWNSIVKARTAYSSLSDLLGKSEEHGQCLSLPKPTGRLEVTNLTLLNERADAPALLDAISFTLKPGACLAVLGASGAGKSTLARLLAGAARPTVGTIRFDGADQQQWDTEHLARHVGFVPQEVSLFEGSVRENIARFEPGDRLLDADEIVVEAARRANAHDMIVRLPEGYNYQLGPYGRGLSAGQAQRVALARALYRKPQYLILDEPNAHLDSESDLLLLATLAELKEAGTTIVMVVHRLNILPVADQVLVLREGKVHLFGARDQVMGQVTPIGQRRIVGGAAA